MFARLRGGVSIVAIATATAACPSPKGPPGPTLPPLETASLGAMAQGPGALYAIVLRPKAIFTGELAPYVSKVVAREGLDRLSARTGFDARLTPDALFVSYAATSLWAAHLPAGANPVSAVDAFDKRALAPQGRASPRADLVRAWGSLPSGARGAIAAFTSARGDTVVSEEGRLGTVLVAIALAEGKLAAARSLAKQAPFDALLPFTEGAEVAFLARCPLDALLRTKDDAKPPVFAQECDGAVITLRARPGGKVAFDVRIAGRWGKDAALVGDEVRGALERVAASDLGRVLGLRDTKTAEVRASPDAVEAHGEVDAGKLADGLRRLLSAELDAATK